MMDSQTSIKVFYILFFIFLVFSFASANEKGESVDETMLMFVGEELSVVSVASRRPESPAAAPAIVRVVDQDAIKKYGFQTLSELLASEPGFYMINRARGTVPFLRGIPDGVLFLYDGVPLSMDVAKNQPPLDRELSLHNIKRVEIVRGPGSVLWGADAFAGIVNVVPFTGREHKGFETKAFYGSDDSRGVFASWGGYEKEWDTFFSVYTANDIYHLDTFVSDRSVDSAGNDVFAQDKIDQSSYVELTANSHIGDWFSISGRWSDFNRQYTMQDTNNLSWPAKRESPVSFIKTSITKIIGSSHLTLTGYYQNIRYQLTDVDYKREQKNDLYYGELLWDKRVFKKGLLTAGVSFRTNDVTGAVVKDNFYPDNPGEIFIPSQQENYSNSLKSIFSQYRHNWKQIELWIGGRVDDYSLYGSSVSYSCGFNWPIVKSWRLKAAYGTAYRSPVSSQIFGDISFDTEGISTSNVQLTYNPYSELEVSITGFHSRLSDYIEEDPYAGISDPSDQEFIGAELGIKSQFFDSIDVYLNITGLNSWGESVKYQSLQYGYVRIDGTREEYYYNWEEPVGRGPDFMARLGAAWRLTPKATISVDSEINNKVPYTFFRNTVFGEYSQGTLLNVTLGLQDLFFKNTDLKVCFKNMLDKDYNMPDLYGPVKSKPFTVYAQLSYRF